MLRSLIRIIDQFSLWINNFNRRDWLSLRSMVASVCQTSWLAKITWKNSAQHGIFRFCRIYLGCRDKTKIFRPCTRLQEHFINKLQPVKVALLLLPISLYNFASTNIRVYIFSYNYIGVICKSLLPKFFKAQKFYSLLKVKKEWNILKRKKKW